MYGDLPPGYKFPAIGAEYSKDADPEYVFHTDFYWAVAEIVREIVDIIKELNVDQAADLIKPKLNQIKYEIVIYRTDAEAAGYEPFNRPFLQSGTSKKQDEMLEMYRLVNLDTGHIIDTTMDHALGLFISYYEGKEGRLVTTVLCEKDRGLASQKDKPLCLQIIKEDETFQEIDLNHPMIAEFTSRIQQITSMDIYHI